MKLVGLESNDEVTSRLKNALLRDRLKEDGGFTAMRNHGNRARIRLHSSYGEE